MKNLKRLLGAVGAVAMIVLVGMISMKAEAQVGFDPYNGMRTVILDDPRVIIGGGNASVTNGIVQDLRQFTGVAKVDVFAKTNGAGACTVTLYTSPDQATWTALGNISLATRTTVIQTNYYYGTNGLTATNVYNLAGAITTPTASTAGFATPYVDNSTPFTNSGAITLNMGRITTLAFNVDDAQRYLQVTYAPSGSLTNVVLGAVLTARPQNGHY